MTNLDNCIEQIAALTESVTALQAQQNELMATCNHLLNQFNKTNTQLILVSHAVEKTYGMQTYSTPATPATPVAPGKQISVYQPAQRVPHRRRSFDGNTPLRKLSKQLEQELETKRA